MKMVSVIQPWATLLVLSAKRIETRSWPTPYRGWLGIHASTSRQFLFLAQETPFSTWLEAGGFGPSGFFLPRGAIVGRARLVDCVRIDTRFARGLSDDEYALGDFTPGRWAWVFGDAAQSFVPVPARGRLGLWDWDERAPVIPPADGSEFVGTDRPRGRRAVG